MILLTPHQPLGFEGNLTSAVLEGMNNYLSARLASEEFFAMSKTTRSSMLHDAVIEAVKLALQGKEFRFVSARQTNGGPSRKILVVDGRFGLQFKLCGGARKGSNVRTRAEADLLQSGFFQVGWAGDLPLQTVLYELDESRTRVEQIWVRTHGPEAQPPFLLFDACPERGRSLFEPDQKPTEIQSDENQGPSPTRRKRIRRPDEGEGDIAAGAVAS